MKKIVTLICLLSVFGINASAADIEVNINLRKINVTAKNTLKAENPTMQLLNADKTRVLYTAEGILSEDKYVFEAFSMSADEVSGDYIIRIGENGKITDKQIYYASYTELRDAVAAAMSDNMTAEELVKNSGGVLDVNKADFSKLPPEWKSRFTKEADALELSTENDEAISDSVDKLKKTFERWMYFAKLFTASEESSIESAAAYFSELDTTYYKLLSDKTCIKRGAEAVGYDIETISEADLFSIFHGSVLTGIINQSDWETGKNAVRYYTEKGLISVEEMYLNADSEVYKALKKKGISDYRTIASALKACYEEHIGGYSGGTSSSGGTGSSKPVGIDAVLKPVWENTQNNENEKLFDDIDSVPWAEEAIEYFAQKGIFQGIGNRKFAPNNIMKRAEFVKLIVLALNITEAEDISFTDVPSDAWYYDYISKAKKSGLVTGMSDTYFGAEDYITRQDMAVIVKRIVDSYGIFIYGEGIKFTDSSEISEYAREAVSCLSGAGIINGMGDGKFSPKAHMTRAQGAKIMYDIICRKGN